MAVFNSSIVLRVARMSVLALSVVFMGSIAAQTNDQRIAERLKPVGEVCLAGESCARSSAAPAATAAATSSVFDVEQTYQQNCNVCHASGMAGAPKLEDTAEWANRIADKGFDTVLANAINGIGAMPPKGMCMTCSDDNIAELVEYITGRNQ